MNSQAELRQLFFRHLAQTSPAPLAIQVEKAEGVWLYGPDGSRILDLISGISVSNVGHRAPEVIDAIEKQLHRYLHIMVYGELILSPQVELAQKLSKALNNRLDQFYFVNSGSEAVEGALKLARRYTGRTGIISFQHSYHGSTTGALSVTGSDDLKNGYGPLLPEVSHIRFNEPDDFPLITDNTAAVIAEPVQAEAGVKLPGDDYFRKLRQRCDETGALLILDEIQTAYGRTGTLFAHEWLGIQPDILLLAKGIGGGMPLGAFAARREIMSCLSHDPILGHITTFGGHPVCCAAGIATLKLVLESKWLGEVPVKEALIREKMKHPLIKAIRGKGLLFAVEFADAETASKVLQNCIRRGVLTDFFLHAPHCLRIAPPLVISESELAWGLEQMIAAMGE